LSSLFLFLGRAADYLALQVIERIIIIIIIVIIIIIIIALNNDPS